MKHSLLLSIFLSISFMAFADGTGQEIKIYPAAEAGFERMFFQLPPVSDESARKVEIIVGKTLSVDCNLHSFHGTLETRVVAGWGYPYYLLAAARGPMSTLMACPPDEQKVDQFINVVGNGFLQAYNSNLPVVVYVPEGFEVRYRIWVAGDEIGHAVRE